MRRVWYIGMAGVLALTAGIARQLQGPADLVAEQSPPAVAPAAPPPELAPAPAEPQPPAAPDPAAPADPSAAGAPGVPMLDPRPALDPTPAAERTDTQPTATPGAAPVVGTVQ